MTTCFRCGSSLKNPVEFQGKVYGQDCVQVVSGLKSWEIQSSNGNLEEYVKQKEVKLAKLKAENEAIENKKAFYIEKNHWLINFLEQFSNPNKSNYNGFAQSMISELAKKEVKDLTERQYDALENMWVYGYEGIQEGYARVSFIAASGLYNMSEQETQKGAKEVILSYATVKELKEIAKENKVKGYSKMKREQLEEELIEYIII